MPSNLDDFLVRASRASILPDDGAGVEKLANELKDLDMHADAEKDEQTLNAHPILSDAVVSSPSLEDVDFSELLSAPQPSKVVIEGKRAGVEVDFVHHDWKEDHTTVYINILLGITSCKVFVMMPQTDLTC